ncbi:MAG: ribonuclease III [Deltaproteobacteria bacterium]|jgi:ribonuclease-3|nr:ribonuclease III [Deltaproteobacteria bacterium]
MTRIFTPIGYAFKDERLLKAALTHRSCVCECFIRDGGEEHDNQRLEFLGDAVLELFISEYLFSLRPRLSEGAMSRVRACFVCEGKLAEIARDIGLGEHLVISQPEDNSGGRDKTSLLADALEALLGAVFLDGGPEETRRLIQKLWRPYLTGCSESPPAISDYKTALQEFTQRKGLGLPAYSLANTVGPAHKPTFFISVRVGAGSSAMAMAHSKKEAAQHAAKILLQELSEEEDAQGCRPETSAPDSRKAGLEGLVMAHDCQPWPMAQDCQPQASDCQPQASDCRPQASDCRPQASDCRPQASDCQPKAAGSQPHISDCLTGVSDCQPRVLDCLPKDEGCRHGDQDGLPKAEDCQHRTRDVRLDAKDRLSDAQDRQLMADERIPKSKESRPDAEEIQPKAKRCRPKAQKFQKKDPDRRTEVKDCRTEAPDRQGEGQRIGNDASPRLPTGKGREAGFKPDAFAGQAAFSRAKAPRADAGPEATRAAAETKSRKAEVSAEPPGEV